jgi:predicted HicB family RNase H-like nuclease
MNNIPTLIYKGYIAQVEFDEEAQIFHGEVIHLRDVITFEATTTAALPQAFAESVEDYLAFCASRGEEASEPHTHSAVIAFRSSRH